MKKIFRNTSLIAVAFLTIFSVAAKAAPVDPTNPVVPAALKYAGMLKENPVFELSVDGQSDDYTISIADINGNRLYSEKIRGDKFTKRFLLNAEELGDDKLYFTVYSRNSNKYAVYEISSNTRYISETTVNLVKQN
ncbi:MAG: hypothetical protein KAX45_10195 [Chitinophagaceae bacterium]|nr:hypothetical protein [Chitinophagaceae bacterium]